MAKIANGEAIEAIEVAVINGVNYVVNGHHRLEAALRSGAELEYKILQPSEWAKYYKTEQEIIEAAAMTSKPKLDGKVVTKAKEEYGKSAETK